VFKREPLTITHGHVDEPQDIVGGVAQNKDNGRLTEAGPRLFLA
jgi:hypothetical protein